jgi:hypothetical protein
VRNLSYTKQAFSIIRTPGSFGGGTTRLVIHTALLLLISVFCLLISAQAAQAACSNPAGNQKDLVYNYSYRVYQYCNGTIWVQANLPIYNPVAVTFDGMNDYLTRGADLSSNGDGTTLTGSFWFRRAGVYSTLERIYANASTRFELAFSAANRFRIVGQNTGATDVVNISSTTTITDTDWHHVMFSVDTNQGCVNGTTTGPGCYIYIDGVAEAVIVTTFTAAGSIDFTQTNHAVGAITTGTNKFIGDLADFWLELRYFSDLSSAANRAEFISGGKPVYLGTNGSLGPTGAAPDVFLSGALASWETNDGSGGGFTENGTLAASAHPVVEAGFRGLGGAANITSGLIGWWKLDDGSGATAADSAGSATMTVSGATWTAGRINGGMNFDGTDDVLAVADPNLVEGISAVTISAWAQSDVTVTTNGRGIVAQHTGSGGDNFNLLLINSDDIGCIIDTGAGGVTANAAMTLQDTGWHHYACVYNGSNIILYIDGMAHPDQPALTGNIIASTNPLSIGQYDTSRNWDGQIDDVRIYSRALSASEVTQLFQWGGGCTGPDGAQGDLYYNTSRNVMQYCEGRNWRPMGKDPGTGGTGCANPSGIKGDLYYNTSQNAMQYCDGTNWRIMGGGVPQGPVAGLVGWWKLDDNTGGTAADSAGSNAGTLQGNAAWSAPGKVGVSAVTLDGTGDYVTIANESNFDFERTQPFSIATWVWRNDHTADDQIIAKAVTGASQYRGIDFGFDNNLNSDRIYLSLVSDASASNYMSARSDGNVTPGEWHHVAATYNGSGAYTGINLYIDGVPQTETDFGFGATLSGTILNNVPVELGSFDGGGAPLAGKLDDVRIYNRELNASEVQQLYYATGGQ